jgi:hypothetical protein
MRRNPNNDDPLASRAKLSHKLVSFSIVEIVVNQYHLERSANSCLTRSSNTWNYRDRMSGKKLAHNIRGEHGVIFDEKNFHCLKAWHDQSGAAARTP